MKKLLTIITVCKNSEQTIERTIKSVKREMQHLDHDLLLEYIIIDGGSSDSTLSIIEKHRTSVDCLVTESDRGIYEAMNKGWKLATGSFVLFLNSDDSLKKSSLQSIVDLLQYARDYNVSVITATTEVIRVKNGDSYNLSLLKFGLNSLFANNPVPHPSTIISRNLLKQYGGFDEQYTVASDYKFFVQVLGDKDNEIITSSSTWVSMQSGGASDQYKSLSNLIKIEKELWSIQLKYFGFTRSLLSLSLRLLSHIKVLIRKK